MQKKLRLILLLGLLTTGLLLGSCSAQTAKTPAPAGTFNITALKGPTGMGFASLMAQTAQDKTRNEYHFTLANEPTEAAAALLKGDADIVALPINLAANLYQKTKGDLQMLAINTLGVLSILENGDEIHSLPDLMKRPGEALCVFGQGATPEYILNALLAANKIEDKNIEYFSDLTELTTWMVDGESAYAMLPEPSATIALAKGDQLRRALDITAEWAKIYPDTPLVQGCLVAKKSLVEKNPTAIAEFLTDYRYSVDYANQKPESAGKMIAEFGILDNAEIAAQALPNCHIVCITGKEMQTAADHMFQVLYEADPASVGGKIPPADLYFGGK